ncbi:GNAT family N-acetyltransferase [Massilia sp. TWP1-3-3]|uniref:GNAT family N-acetyltransferase n=1 Tax=Massilia sp. TWP1-3-3 TaxID=2804573 RepID=UPI003CEC47CB
MLSQYSHTVPDCTAGYARGGAALTVTWAGCEDEVRAAQRLRYRIFGGELGARLPGPARESGLDADRFDPFCDHLLVHAASATGQPLLVGTYRVLAPDGARRAGGFYSDAEFDLAPLRALRPRALELGRSCVHPDYRNGGVILALWSALGRYMLQRRLETMIGCASISLAGGPEAATAIWESLHPRYLAAPCWQVRARHPLELGSPRVPTAEPTARFAPDTPPLIKGYLRCGAMLLGPPALDRAFNTADLPIMLRLDDLAPRYRKHFLGQH